MIAEEITKRKRVEDETAGIDPANLLPTQKRTRRKGAHDIRNDLAKKFERCSLSIGTLRSNLVREDSVRNTEELRWRQVSCVWLNRVCLKAY